MVLKIKSLFIYMCMINDSEVYKKGKYMNKLEIVFKNRNFCNKFFDFYTDS